jgi:transcription-repair coupling factor (superfamily II helicase)
MLVRAIREMNGEAAPEEAGIHLNLGLNIRIPSEYIAEENQRLRMYKRVAGVETDSQLRDVSNELTDRYGKPPAPVRNLLDYATLKLAAIQAGATVLERKRDLVNIVPPECGHDPGSRALWLRSAVRSSPDGTLKHL